MSVTIDRIEVACFRVPIDTPVVTSFGVMTSRPAVLVRLQDAEGAFGWGEIFANWPAAGAEHRARLLVEDMADLVLGRSVVGPAELGRYLTAATRIRAIQCGEPGPFAQVVAGLDTALHDLFARRAGLPLAHYLNADAPGDVPVYASGIAACAAPEAVARAQTEGFRAFKIKVGFDIEDDVRALRSVLAEIGDGMPLMADANQAWTVAQACSFCDATADLGLGWLEEPLPADAATEDWTALRKSTKIPLAAGENISGSNGFATAIASGDLAVLQPDVAKWGGVAGCARVGRRAMDAGLRYCPHFLGAGIGLLASAHLLAAMGGDGLLEVDVNPNPLRDAFDGTRVDGRGRLVLSDAPGLGVRDLPEEIARFRTLRLDVSR
ncbi:mandelate racemase/muconate lactonizing enzyme family protein [Jannaschia sp. S6380]|uniref:mandelate racemase/muconate lactonizing enzyme family protein n=1 Tax=Jannaschia sp. S6380 TaxID=2926408 RepID=UPI001FF219A3|nr:mandelate racemase/muconate lactonizing enzyme family protein [Jannaschia sp. S6380]MCK0167339.1 mandelate racemase/muconate lactonizing enzyme family protein [Jannaschia sp. S6380]